MISVWKTPDGNAPPAPFYAVIFISVKGEDLSGYEAVDDLLMQLASEVPGYLGYSSISVENKGMFISYWRDREAIDIWRRNADHRRAKAEAPRKWYDYYHSMISVVESSLVFDRAVTNSDLKSQ